MIQLIHCLYNSHDKISRDFADTVPEGVAKYCFYTQNDEPAVQEHCREDGAYPYVGIFPSILLNIPRCVVPEYTRQLEVEPGVFETVTTPEVVVEEHYKILEPCETYQKALEAIAIYEDNLRKVELGEWRYDPYPYEFLQQTQSAE